MSTLARRARLVRRHHLDGSATSALEATRGVLALHATDPATVHVSVLVRAAGLSLDDVAREMYDEAALVRLMAMRRTLFVVAADDAATVQAAAARGVARTVRARLVGELTRLPTDPPLPDDARAVEAWLDDVMDATATAARDLGPVAGARLSAVEPRLRTALLPTTDKSYDVRRTVTTQVLVLMGLEGRLVRHRPGGGWTSRQHTWVAAADVPALADADSLDESEAQAALVGRYLERFGPATEVDVCWWTGWGKGVTRAALARAGAVETADGWVAAGDAPAGADGADGADGAADVPPEVAALLPALDPTPMGWKERAWFLPEDGTAAASLYDRFGNVGPTVWWAGEVVGGWAVRPDGRVVTRLLVDRGAACRESVAAAAAALEPRLEGAAWTPSFPTPLEKQLRTG